MATLMDFIMAQRGSPDYTLGSRATLQPTGSPFSPDGRLGNMGARNMMNAQQGLANSYMPAQQSMGATGNNAPRPTETASPISNMSTMAGFMPPYYSVPTFAETRAPFVPQPDPGYEGAAGRRLSGALLAMQPQPGYDMPPIPPSGVPALPPAREIGAAPGMQLPRPANAGAPMQLGSAAPSVRESFMQRLLGGPNYQSNSMPVVPQGGAQSVRDINFADPDNAADFFRAERALRALPEETLRMAGLLG
jgi:hypothetical protein